MKLKYQMRGLGIGIMITALLMGVASGKESPLSDAEIRAKALELGMVERESLKLTDLAGNASAPTVTASPEESGAAVSDEAGMDGAGETGAAPKADGSSDSDAVSGTENPNEPGADSDESALAGVDSGPEQGGVEQGDSGADPQDGEEELSGEDAGGLAGEAVTVIIEFGVTSAHVSEILEEAGLVEDADAFDAYLCSNGYSRKITAGIYEIQPGASEEEIIQIITKNR